MSFIDCVVSNVAIAAVLGLVAAIVGRITTKPQITHTLWLLVLVKLVTPPVVHIPVSYPVSEPVALASSVDSAMATSELLPSSSGESNAHDAVYGTGVAPLEVSIPAVFNQATDTSDRIESVSAVPWVNILAGVWVAGSLIWFLVAGTRLMRFKKVLRYAHSASEHIRAEVNTIASRYGLRNIPRVLVADAKVPPLIWSFGRRTYMVLPSGLLDKLGADERAGLLAHELAHLRRYDHWIRWFEFVVLGVYWWNPIAWWARAQVQQAEEECCDGWVLWAFPGKARLYAQTLVDTVEFLAGSPERKPDIATAFNQGNSLKRRIEMIINKPVSRELAWRSRGPLLLFALVVAPISLLAQGETIVQTNNLGAENEAPEQADDQRTLEPPSIPESKPAEGKANPNVAESPGGAMQKVSSQTRDKQSGSVAHTSPPQSNANRQKGRQKGIDVELLELGASTNQANLETLRTWSGRVAVTHRASSPPWILHVDFVYDRVRQASRWTWKEVSQDHQKKRDDPEEVGESRVLWAVKNGIIKNDTFYSMNQVLYMNGCLGMRDGNRSVMKFYSEDRSTGIDRDNDLDRARYFDVDPTRHITDYHGSLSIARRWRSICEAANRSEDLSHVSVTRDGDYIILELRKGGVLNRTTIDLSQGGLRTAYEAGSGGIITVRWSFQNVEVAGVWLPKRITYERGVNREGFRDIHQEFEWLENRVNEPAGEEEFALGKIGARRGDKLFDEPSHTMTHLTGDE